MNPIYVDAGKLDLNQRGIYNLKLDAKFIVKGCAGSGKTSLALLRMKQLLASESA
jgi:DNA helicase IV